MHENGTTCHPSPRIPPQLVGGSLVVAGNGIFEIGKQKFTAPMDSFGKLFKFEMKAGEVCFTFRTMETKYWNDSMRLGRVTDGILFSEPEPPRPACKELCDLLAPNDNVYVNSMQNGKQVTMVTDNCAYLDVDIDTVRVTREHKFVDKGLPFLHYSAMTSAHPWRVADGHIELLGTYEAPTSGHIGYTNFVKISDKDDGKSRELLARMVMKGSYYDHSFAITHNFAILPLNMVLDFPNPVGKRIPMMGNFKSALTGFAVLDFRLGTDVQEPRMFNVSEAFYHTHFANA